MSWKDKPCRIWTKAVNPGGYGRKTVRSQTYLVHRLEWKKHNGPIPFGKKILHHCDNPPCYEITHLFIGTQSDNIKDSFEKNRHSQKGERNARSILTEGDVKEIKLLLKNTSVKEIADKFRVSTKTIYNIKYGDRWKHVN